MIRPLLRIALTLTVVASAVACGSESGSASGDSDTYTLRIGATSPTGTPAGSLGWGDKKGILEEKLKAAGVDRIEYAFFQSGSDVASALFAGAIDVAAIGDNPALRARGRDPRVVLLSLDSINGDAWLVGAKGGPTDIAGLVGKTVTAPQGTIRDRAAKQLIDAAGLSEEIQVRDVPTPESIAGLNSGQIDATVLTGASAIELQEKGFPVIDSLSKHGFGSTGTNIALTDFTEAHPGFADAWRDAITAVNEDIVENFDEYAEWVAVTDDTNVDYVKKSISVNEFNTEPFPEQGVEQLEAAYEFLKADGSIETDYSVQEWAGARS
jgi:sulfonate transport system substrate-binding protein